MSAGAYHSCGLKTDGTVACWGDNRSGQAPGWVAGPFQQVSAGYTHSCGLKTDGTVACWGDNVSGQLYSPGGTFSQVSSGADHSCGLKTDGTIACWGSNSSGQAPGLVAGSFLQVSSGAYHSCGLKTDGTIACWGDHSSGQTPALLAGTFVQVSAGYPETCGVKSNNTVVCWWEYWGQTQNVALSQAYLQNGITGTAYSQALTASGGSGAPYSFAIEAGSLPPGLSLASDGSLSGTPTVAGTYRFTVRVFDKTALLGGAKELVLVISSQSPATLLPSQWNGSGPLATGSGDRVISTIELPDDGTMVYAATGSGTVLAFNGLVRVISVVNGGTGSGTVSASGCGFTWFGSSGGCPASDGASLTLSAAPAINSDFTGWSGGSGAASACSGTGACSLTASNDGAVTANFAVKRFNVQSQLLGSGGSFTPATTQQVDYDTILQFSVIPDTGYRATMGGSCGGSLSGSTYNTNPVTSDCTVSASFSNNYSLTYTAGANGSISGSSPQTVSYGGSGTQVTALPDIGYQFIAWSDGSTDNPRIDSHVAADISVTAIFGLTQRLNLTVSSADTSGGSWVGNSWQPYASGANLNAIELATRLASGSATIDTTNGAATEAGDITISAPISWTGNSLALKANGSIRINAVMSATGTAALSMNSGGGGVIRTRQGMAGFVGRVDFSSSGSLSINNETYTIIISLGSASSSNDGTLQGIAGNLSGRYALGADIEASTTAGWAGGFLPAGSDITPFTGKIDGLGHKVSGLKIIRPATDYCGLLGYGGSGALLRNLGMESPQINCSSFAGSLSGLMASGSAIDNSYSVNGTIVANYNAGGLVGSNIGSITFGAVRSGTFGASDYSSQVVGGVAGANSGVITSSFSDGVQVKGNLLVGGISGWNSGTLTDVYSSPTVSALTGNVIGALVGTNTASGTISNSYGAGTFQYPSCYASCGGLIGSGSGSVTNSIWNTDTAGAASAAGTGKTTALMKNVATYTGWSMDSARNSSSIWWLPANSYPLLRQFQIFSTVTYNSNGASSGSVPMDSTYYLPAETATVSGNSGTLTRTVFSFAGWNTASDGSGTSYQPGATFTLGNANVTLYAKWTPPSPPTVTTLAASSVSSNQATLNASINATGSATTGWFRYSTTNPGSCNDTFGTATATASLGSGTTLTALNQAVTGLTTGATYYFCAIANNQASTTFGSVLSFTINSVTYNGNGNTGGSVPLDSAIYTNGNSVTILANSGGMTRTGFLFAGWNSASDGSGASYQPGSTLTIGNAGITLYAIWQQIKVTAIVVDPATPATLYAAIDNDGIHKSTDSGASWTKLANQPGSIRTLALLFHPTTPGTLYTATYGGGIWQSVDSGAIWSACSNGVAGSQNALSLAIGQAGVLYAGTEGGIFTSPDCSSWSAVNSGLTVDATKPPLTIVIDGSTLYAGLDGLGIWNKVDTGDWTAASTGLPSNSRVKALAKKDSATLYAAIYGGGVFKSSDSGAAWAVCSNGATPNSGLTNLNVVSLIIDASGKLYAGTEGGVFVSADGCGTWTAMNGGLP